MNYWADTMQDDAYLIAADGWKAETYRIIETKKTKDGKPGKQVDKGWTCDLLPKLLIVARYFATEQEEIDELSAELERVESARTELEEEHGGDDGAFAELDKVNRANVSARIKELARESRTLPGKGKSALPLAAEAPAQGEEDASETAILMAWMKLSDQEARLKKELKAAETQLDEWAYGRYPTLTESEVVELVVEGKWMNALEALIHGELERVSQRLTQRVKELAERYDTSLPVLTERVDTLEKKVNGHLKKMGFTWT
jgi:type I restriction enzyme M protein